jgi:hypothetical protein
MVAVLVFGEDCKNIHSGEKIYLHILKINKYNVF